MSAVETHIFKPGDGALPPALTGRDAEQGVLRRCLADLVAGAAPPHNVVLIGPRGNGKTALLNWFRSACGQADRRVDVVALTPPEVPNEARLVNALARRRLASWLPRKVGVASVGSAEWQRDDVGQQSLARVLEARCRRRPCAVLIDEAHTLDAKVGGALLNASQQVRAEAPFLLVLAGTPGLLAHLGTMDATFWGRLGRGRLGIGLLSEAAAQEAVSKPLADHRVAIDREALAAVAQHSQCYPFFVQLWGDALWTRHQATGASRLTDGDRAAAEPEVRLQVTEYYEDRYRELENRGLLAAAVAVAPLFRADSEGVSDHDLDDALAAAGVASTEARVATREALNALGYIWCPPGQLPPIHWRPGIPSLTTHVLNHAQRR